jgi:hypothetical protein
MLAFDTLKYSDTLKAAGVSESQARAQATALADAFEAHFDRLATKDDLRHLAGELRHELRNEVGGLRNEIRLVDTNLQGQIGHLKWMFGIIAAAALLSVAKQFFG